MAMCCAVQFLQNLNECVENVVAPDMKLKKGSYYHTTFAMLGTMAFFFSGFGLPFCISVLPHPIQFIIASSDRDEHGNVLRVTTNIFSVSSKFLTLSRPEENFRIWTKKRKNRQQ
jgi:hypothetical protein